MSTCRAYVQAIADLRIRVQGFGWGKTRGTGKRRDGDEFNVRVI